jgi:endonuclease/exonuclease/phosphatase family metal-dependent hydrolase
MPTLKIGTFNVENLFLRYRLLDKEKGSMAPKPIDKERFLKEGGSILMLGQRLEDFGPVSKALRTLTAKCILANDPDVVALQEIETLEALKLFNRFYLQKHYPYQILVDGNDPRQIDVGLISKYPLGNIRTHQFETVNGTSGAKVFSRDCLEVDVVVGGRPLTILVNHFKSKIGGGEEKRKRQAQAVVRILEDRFGSKLKGDFVVAGDLNMAPTETEAKPLLNAGLVNLIDRLPVSERWTHYYKKTKAQEQLDYLLLSPTLAKKSTTVPSIERRGLGTDIDVYTGPRFSGFTGKEGASDHCPVFFDLKF